MKKNFAKYSDKELVELLRGNTKYTEAAFTEIYDRYGLRVNAYCRSILNDREAADDVFQETFIKFYQYVKSDYKSGSIIGFLITIARNLCLNAKRDKKVNIPIKDFDLLYDGNRQYEDKELEELLTMGLDLIDEEFKEALVLRYYNDMRYREIGRMLGITEARARYLVFTGKQKIKQLLTPYFKDVYK